MPAIVRTIPIDSIRRYTAPIREHLDILDPDVLADAVTNLHQRPVVRYVPSPHGYVLVLGEDAIRTAQRHARITVEALVLNDTQDDAMKNLIDAVAERIGQPGITPLEEAVLFHRLSKRYSTHGIAARTGKLPAYVRSRMELLDLCPDGQAALGENRLPIGLAWHISRLPAGLQTPFLHRWTGGEFTNARTAEAAARALAAFSAYDIAQAALEHIGDLWGAEPGPDDTTAQLRAWDGTPFTLTIGAAGEYRLNNDQLNEGLTLPVSAGDGIDVIARSLAGHVGHLY
ncbi:hypothetical protein OG272_15940 [Streptomyces sp. NBC_00104]|uniref:ParB/RepB/Spo0J family partition protein n=1 Tax=Streptomyces sp. NBC_00104 TaxID=2903621 RepID=UPI0032472BAB